MIYDSRNAVRHMYSDRRGGMGGKAVGRLSRQRLLMHSQPRCAPKALLTVRGCRALRTALSSSSSVAVQLQLPRRVVPVPWERWREPRPAPAPSAFPRSVGLQLHKSTRTHALKETVAIYLVSIEQYLTGRPYVQIRTNTTRPR